MARLRIALVGTIGVVLGFVGGEVFDELVWVLPLAAVVPTVGTLLVAPRPSWLRFVVAATTVVLSTVIAVLLTSGATAGDIVDAFVAGPQRLLTTEWPSPARPDLVGTIALLIAASTAIAAELALRPRWHLLPLAPEAITYVLLIGLSAPAGPTLLWLLVLGPLAVMLAALRHGTSISDRATVLAGERRSIPLVAIAIAVAMLVSIPISMTARADPRRNEPPARTAPLLDPIEATAALRRLDPPIDTHAIDLGDGTEDVVPTRWRTAALSDYDGERWLPALTIRPIGRTLGVADDSAIDVSIDVLEDDLLLLPLPGPPVSVDAMTETDADRTIVRLVDIPDGSIAVTANLAPVLLVADDVPLATREIDDAVSGLTELAEELGGDGTTIERLDRIATTMRDEFVLDSNVQGGGLQQALLERFLRDTRRGTAEQFAASYVLLARALGADARVATGFELQGRSLADGAGGEDGGFTITSSDARVWPELALQDGSWVAIDPIPPQEAPNDVPTPPEPQSQTPAAPQPPIAPPPEPANEEEAIDETAGGGDDGALSTAVDVLLRVIAVGALALMPIVVAAAAILALKARRRRKRLNASASTDRIRGAWATATDALVDAGLAIGGSATDGEIALAGERVTGSTARWELLRLAKLSSAATFGSPPSPGQLERDATSCLQSIETAIVDERTPWQRLRWRLSLRSLRRATRSPVTV